jgi:transposase-like protein
MDSKRPNTLLEAVRYFSDQDRCLSYVASMIWPSGEPVCPHCKATGAYFLKSRRIYKCKACRKQFSVKHGTIFEDSPIGLDKWLTALWMIASAKNGISSWELHRSIGVTQKTAWFMLHRIRLAMQTKTFRKLSGEVEADETYIGGLARNMHKSQRAKKIKGTGGMGKVVVMGLLERHGEVRTKVIPNTKQAVIHAQVRKNVEPGAKLYTDQLKSYKGLDPDFVHQFVNHAEKYVEGRVHTNGMENFWSLTKRCIKGTYVSIAPFHTFRYLDEEAFRFNTRKQTDGERFNRVLSQVSGRRVDYKHLTGAEPATA